MSHQKVETISHCFGGRHYSGTVSIQTDITKTGRK